MLWIIVKMNRVCFPRFASLLLSTFHRFYSIQLYVNHFLTFFRHELSNVPPIRAGSVRNSPQWRFLYFIRFSSLDFGLVLINRWPGSKPTTRESWQCTTWSWPTTTGCRWCTPTCTRGRCTSATSAAATTATTCVKSTPILCWVK